MPIPFEKESAVASSKVFTSEPEVGSFWNSTKQMYNEKRLKRLYERSQNLAMQGKNINSFGNTLYYGALSIYEVPRDVVSSLWGSSKKWYNERTLKERTKKMQLAKQLTIQCKAVNPEGILVYDGLFGDNIYCGYTDENEMGQFDMLRKGTKAKYAMEIGGTVASVAVMPNLVKGFLPSVGKSAVMSAATSAAMSALKLDGAKTLLDGILYNLQGRAKALTSRNELDPQKLAINGAIEGLTAATSGELTLELLQDLALRFFMSSSTVKSDSKTSQVLREAAVNVYKFISSSKSK